MHTQFQVVMPEEVGASKVLKEQVLFRKSADWFKESRIKTLCRILGHWHQLNGAGYQFQVFNQCKE